MSGLAAKTAPPEMPERVCLSPLAFIGLCLFYPAGIYYYFCVHKPKLAKWEAGAAERDREYLEQIDQYERMWLCMDCGSTSEFE